MTPDLQDSPRPAGCSRGHSHGLLLLSLQFPFLPSSLHSTPPNTWLGTRVHPQTLLAFSPLSGEKGLGCRSGRGGAGSLLSALHEGGWASEGRCQVCDLPCPGLPGKSSSAAQVRLDLRAVRVLQPGLGPFPEQTWPLDTPALPCSFPWGSLAAGGGLAQERIKSSSLRPSPVSRCLLLPSPEPVLPHMALGPKSHRACPLNGQGHSPRDAELPGPHSTLICCIEL